MPNPFFFAGKITNPEYFVGQEYGSSRDDGEGCVEVREIVKIK